MKEYAEKDMLNFEKNDCGLLVCPTGDYTGIKNFGKRCSFAPEGQ